jgi:multiple sugar transport system permease protein
MSNATAAAAPRRRSDGWRWTGRVYLVVLLAFAILPMLWMVLTSIKTQFAALQYPPEWWPSNPTISQYTTLLDPTSDVGREFLTYLWNSVWVSTITTILGVIVAVPAAYAFSRFRFPGRRWLFYAVLLRNMFPAVVFLIPLFIMMRWLHLVNTQWSLVLTYLTFGLPLPLP